MFRPDPAAIADPPPAERAAPERARAMIEVQLVMLTRLAEIGMGIAEDAGRRSATLPRAGVTSGAAGGCEAEAHAPDPGLTYSRVARAVRLTLALQSRLLADLAGLERDEHLARASERTRRRNRIERMVELAIEAEHADPDEIERLSGEARERLDDEDEFGDLLARPLGEIVACICADLGLSTDWNAAAFAGAPFEGAAVQAPRDGVAASAHTLIRTAAGPPGDAAPWTSGMSGAPPPVRRRRSSASP